MSWDREEVAEAAQLACLLEASAEKPGNVTPSRSFADMAYEDLLRSAVAIRPAIAEAGRRHIGETVLRAVTATRRACRVNTNLGIVLLLAPLARAALAPGLAVGGLRAGTAAVLRGLDRRDAEEVYAAIRLAQPGGLGEAAEHDVREAPAVGLREAMASAAGRDSVASEYVSDFALTFDVGAPAIRRARERGLDQREAIVQAYLELLAAVPDTLIARKRGAEAAHRVSEQAAAVLAAGGLGSAAGRAELVALDASLRSPDHALNPGTTADLVTAAAFVVLLTGAL